MKKIKKRIDKILESVLITLMSILLFDVLWQVLSRYILSSPSSFTDELAGFLLIWVGVLGAAYVTGKKEHLAIDLLIQKSNPTTQKNLKLIINIMIGLFALFVMIVGGSWLMFTRFQLNVNSAALHLPLGYVYCILPISGLLMLYYSIDFIISNEEGMVP
jgi:TRAP-type C4-dicarboxylate transport system permease small subunit